MDREEIQKHIPHRQDMLLLDSCERTGEGTSKASYTVTGDEFFLRGHFPEYPVVPGVIICEIMAQGCFPIFQDDLQGCIPMYAGIKSAKFKKSVFPGDTLEVQCQVLNVKKPFYSVQCNAFVGGALCAAGELMFCLVKKSKVMQKDKNVR